MNNFFISLNPTYQALLAGLFTFFITVLGSSLVFFFKSINKFVMDMMLSISAGIMLSASFFSLLGPAIEMADNLKLNTWIIILSGFILGGILLFIISSKSISEFKSSIMLFLSITLHNIPEGLVIGVAYGAVLYGFNSLISAILLTIGIGIQNFPEGSAISLPLRRDGISRFKAFLFGSISALVEPIFAVIGAILVLRIRLILPFILSFTAGAMIFVTVLELIPEALSNKRKDLMALFVMCGFSLMMVLELLLG